MNRQFIEAFNLKCAKFIGYEWLDDFNYPEKNNIGWYDNQGMYIGKILNFHTDWNEIHKVIDFIHLIRIRVPDYNVIEWFSVDVTSNICTITSGLRNADGETKTPYYYSEYNYDINNKNAVILSLNNFIDWFNENKEQWKKNIL